MDYSYYEAHQSYPQTPIQSTFDQRGWSSASQPQAQPLQAQNAHVPSQAFSIVDHYDYGQPDVWLEADQERIDLPSVNTGDVNITDIQDFTSSSHEPPWDPTVGAKGRNIDNSFRYYPPSASAGPRAHTVAGALCSPHTFQRPFLGRQRQSLVSTSDSGYGSQPPVADNITSSTPTEVKQDAFRPDEALIADRAKPAPPSSVKTEPAPGVKRRRPRSFASSCEQCGKDLKSRSEAVKHSLQHLKPYKCELCLRVDGFATKNDLERHRKSVHGVSPRVGKKTYWVCKACKFTPGAKKKPWPRLDNFKSHVLRRHASADLVQLIKLSEVEPDGSGSRSAYSLASASNSPDDMIYQQESLSPNGAFPSGHIMQQSPHGDVNAVYDHNSAHQVAHVGGAGDFHGNNMASFRFRPDSYTYSSSMMMPPTTPYPGPMSPAQSTVYSQSNMRSSIPTLTVNDEAYDQEDEMQQAGRMSKRARFHDQEQLTHSPLSASSTLSSYGGSAVTSTHAEGQFPCPKCPKVKKRECDLRKHMKRHTRPYGCTFAKCSKRFGSRNDWKRHENTQHFLDEMWRCSFKAADQAQCGHLAHDRQQFAKHLATRHGVREGTEESKSKCREMHLGREGHHHFWCGFCDKLIEQASGIQPKAWDLRFQHIGDHFDKDNCNIDEWVDIEKNKKKKLIEDEEKPRGSGSRLKTDDDSDLGEDGIPKPYFEQMGRYSRMPAEDDDADGVSDDESRMR